MKYYIENDDGERIELNKFEYYTLKVLKFIIYSAWVALLLALIIIIIPIIK